MFPRLYASLKGSGPIDASTQEIRSGAGGAGRVQNLGTQGAMKERTLAPAFTALHMTGKAVGRGFRRSLKGLLGVEAEGEEE